MSRAAVYLGEADGGRVIKLGGDALTQITSAGTEDVLLDAETWDLVPLGPAGDSVFRMIIVTIQYSNGYAVRVTPTVDGVALAAQDFSGAGAGTTALQAWVVARGARCSVRVEQTARTGDFELVNVQAAFVPLREVP